MWLNALQQKLTRAMLGSTVLVCAISSASCDVQQRITYNMTWKVTAIETPRPPDGTRHIELRFEQFPHSYIGFSSNDLGTYLESSARSVPVEFEITSDFGCMRGFRITKIGN